MFARNVVATLVAVVILGVLAVASIGAVDNARRTTSFTFPRAVQLPGVTLPAGSYTFEIADPGSNLDIVRVTSNDRSRVYVRFTRLVTRSTVKNMDSTIVLGEASGSTAPPIKAWYPAGQPTGRQFQY